MADVGWCGFSLLVKAWNYSSLPGYEGGFWGKEASGSQRGGGQRKG